MVDTERSAKFPMDSGNWTFAKKFGVLTRVGRQFFIAMLRKLTYLLAH